MGDFPPPTESIPTAPPFYENVLSFNLFGYRV